MWFEKSPIQCIWIVSNRTVIHTTSVTGIVDNSYCMSRICHVYICSTMRRQFQYAPWTSMVKSMPEADWLVDTTRHHVVPTNQPGLRIDLTHWGRVTHICVGNLTIIGSDNGLSPDRRQAIIWTNAGILLIEPLGTDFSGILSEIHKFSFKKMHLKMSSAKWHPFFLGLNVVTSCLPRNNATWGDPGGCYEDGSGCVIAILMWIWKANGKLWWYMATSSCTWNELGSPPLFSWLPAQCAIFSNRPVRRMRFPYTVCLPINSWGAYSPLWLLVPWCFPIMLTKYSLYCVNFSVVIGFLFIFHCANMIHKNLFMNYNLL